MRKVAILLGLILVAGVVVPFIPSDVYATHNGSHIIDIASGAELEHGSIVYIDTSAGYSSSVNFEVSKSSGAEVTLITELPGAEFLSVNSNLLFFSWSVSDLPDDVTLPVAYSVTFNTALPTGLFEEKNILIAIETEVPPVGITFDRTGYVAGDTAIIMLNDARANLHDSFDFDEDGNIDNLDSIQVGIRIQGPAGLLVQTLTAQESEEEPGTFVAEYTIPDGNYNHIKAIYKGQQVIADIGRSIWIDDTHYEIGDEIQVLVRDSGEVDGDANSAIVVEVVSDSVAMDLVLDEEGDNGIFEAMIEPSNSDAPVAGVQRITANVNDTITLSYQNQMVQAKIIDSFVKFDREWYANSEFATITVVDKEMNVDKHARDTLPVEVTSDSDDTPITSVLIETGSDTAIFRSYEMVLVTNDTEVAFANAHSVFAEDGDTILVTYSGGSAETLVGIPAGVGITPIPDDEGVGESGIPPFDAQTIFSGITNLSCGSYGDTDADGLCDNWEPGGTYLKITYGGTLHTFTESCGPCPTKTKDDIYLEVDYDSTLSGYPSNLSTALANVKNAFAASPVGGGVVLHYYVDDGLSNLPEDVKIWSDDPANPTPAVDSYTEIKQQNFGLIPTWSSNKDRAWHNAVHYALVIKDQAHDQGSSGIAEVVGDDIVVSLFGFANSVDQIQGTFMHELGHNLGLDHGGGLETFPPTPGPPETYDWFVDSDTNCKPNYPSVMEYSRQFTNMFTGNTLKYSPGSLKVAGLNDAPLLVVNGLDEPEPSGGLQPPSGSTVTFVYGVPNPTYNPGLPSNYEINQPISQSNPVNFPRMPIVKQVTNSDYDVDWNNNGVSTNVDVTNNIFDFSLLGCDVASNPIPAGNKIYDHNDWNSLVMNFRYYNPDSLLTGSRIVSPGTTEITWEQLKVHGVADLDRAFQSLDEDLFFEGIDETSTDDTLVLLFAGSGVDFSRTMVPIPPMPGSATADLVGNAVVTTLIVMDPNKNIGGGTEDSIPFLFGSGDGQLTIQVAGDGFSVMVDSAADYTGAGCLTFNGVCLDDILSSLPNLVETGDSTGVFEGELEFVSGGLNASDWDDLEITFNYHDVDGDEESGTIIFRGSNGIIDAQPSSATSGTILTITIEDNDLNLDDNEADFFDSSTVADDDALLTIETLNEAIGAVDIETFDETGEDTGIFTASFQVGSDIPITSGGNSASCILITYNDEIDSTGGKGIEHRIRVPISGLSCGPSQDEIHEILMVQDGSNPSVAANVQRFGNPSEAVNQLEFIMTGIDGSIGGDDSDDWLEEDGQEIVTPKTLALLAVLKLVELNEPFNGPDIKTFELSSHYSNIVYTIFAEAETITPIVNSFVYDPDEKMIRFFIIGQGNMNVTVPNAISESFEEVTIQRTGEEVEFEEISSNSTHTTYELVDIPYYPGPEGVSMTYFESPPIPDWPVSVDVPVPKSLTGDVLDTVTENTQVILCTTLKNTETTPQSFAGIIEVRDSNGITIFLAWQTGTLNAMGETEVCLSWIPEEPGEYEVRVLALSGIMSPEILSQIESNVITVAENTGGTGGTSLPGGGAGGSTGGACMLVVCP